MSMEKDRALWRAARELQSIQGEMSSAVPQLFGRRCSLRNTAINDCCIVLVTDLVNIIHPGNMKQLSTSFFKFSQHHPWVMGDPIVIEQVNMTEKEAFFITETNLQVPSTCPPCLLGELAPCVSVSLKAREQSTCHQ